MTPEEIAARKGRVYSTLGAGIAALIGAYLFSRGRFSGTASSTVVAYIFLIIATACFMLSGKMARMLNKKSSK